MLAIQSIFSTSTVSAAPDDTNNAIYSYQAYRTMAWNCIWQDGDGEIFTATNTWMQSSPDLPATNRNQSVGSVFTNMLGLGADTARVDCDNANGWVDKALTMWGYPNGEAFLNDLVKTGNGKGMRKEADGGFTKLGSAGRSSELTEVITQTLKNKGVNVGGLPPAANYLDWLTNFESQCNAKFSADSSSPSRGGEKVKETKYHVNDTGDTEKGWWHYDTGGSIAVGTAIKEDGVTDCEQIANEVANNKDGAKAYGQAIKNGTAGKPTTPTGGTPDGADKESGCSQALTPFGWILCPITTFADDIVDWYQQVVKSILYIDPGVLADSNLKQVWRIFSNLASALIVLIALTMIAGQIFNFEIFSAYTVKKVLPRLVIGAILIQLSWFLCATLIQLTNAVGSGIYWLLLSPFKYGSDGNASFVTFEQVISSGAGNTNINGTDILANAVGLVGVGGAVAVGIASGAWIMLIVAAIGVLISLVVALITLMLRAMFIVILLVLAPVAIAAWILPGTQRFWDMWWKMFSKLLMMFPLIMLLFAGGVMAATVLKTASGAEPTKVAGAGVLLNFAVLVAYFAPIFMISMTYKFAGGAFASIATLSNKLGDKASGSGLFGLRDRAKFAKENSSWAQARKNREGEKTRAAHSKYGERIGGDSRYGKFLLRRASGSQDGQARLKAAAEKAHFDERMKESADLLDYQTSLGSMAAPESAKEYLKIFKAQEGSKVAIKTGKKDAAGNDIMQTVVATEHLQRQAVDRIAQTQQITQLRAAQAHAKAQGGSSLSQSIMQSTLNKNYVPIKDKAPDLVGSGLHTVDAARMTAWDASTWENWQKQYKNRLVFPPETQSALEAQANDLASNENIILNDLARKALDDIGHAGRP